jgi:hypothetical protein
MTLVLCICLGIMIRFRLCPVPHLFRTSCFFRAFICLLEVWLVALNLHVPDQLKPNQGPCHLYLFRAFQYLAMDMLSWSRLSFHIPFCRSPDVNAVRACSNCAGKTLQVLGLCCAEGFASVEGFTSKGHFTYVLCSISRVSYWLYLSPLPYLQCHHDTSIYLTWCNTYLNS